MTPTYFARVLIVALATAGLAWSLMSHWIP